MMPLGIIISSTCLRHHNLRKMCQNFTKFSHIEEYKKTVKKTSEFLPRPVAKCTNVHFCSFIMYFLHINLWKQNSRTQNLTFCGFRMPGKLNFAHSPLSKLHLALTMTTTMCLCQSAASPKHQNSAKNNKVAALFWLHSRNGWGILGVLDVGKCGYSVGKKDISLWATAQIPHEILARELIGIYKVKFAAK